MTNNIIEIPDMYERKLKNITKNYKKSGHNTLFISTTYKSDLKKLKIPFF